MVLVAAAMEYNPQTLQCFNYGRIDICLCLQCERILQRVLMRSYISSTLDFILPLFRFLASKAACCPPLVMICLCLGQRGPLDDQYGSYQHSML